MAGTLLQTMARKYCLLVRIVLLAAPLVLGAGCTFSARGKQAAFLESQQSQLYSEDPTTADRAALVLLSSGNDNAYRVLKAALRPPNSPTTRAAVIRAFITDKDGRIRGEMLAALGDENEVVAALAKSYLCNVIGDDAYGEVLAIAADAALPVGKRVAALEVLGTVGAEGAVEGLIGLLGDPSREVGDAAVSALGEITYQPFGNDSATWRVWYRENRKLGRQQWRKVWSFYYGETERLKAEVDALQQRLAALEAETIAAYRSAIDLAIHAQRYEIAVDILAKAGPIEVQMYAAEQLGKVKASQAGPVLMEKAEGDDPRLSRVCIDALSLIGYSEATSTVLRKMTSPDVPLKVAGIRFIASIPQSDLARLLPYAGDGAPEVRSEVAKAFGGRRYQEGGPVLVAMLTDDSADVVAAAALALGQVGDPQAAQRMIVLMSHKDERVRYAVLRGLTDLGVPSSSYDAFLSATRDPARSIREAAAVGLGKLRDKRSVDRLLEMVLTDPDAAVASQAWKSLEGIASGDTRLVLSLSHALQSAGRFATAEPLLKGLADSNGEVSDVVEAQRRLATAYLEAGKYQAARVYFQRILDRYPADAEALSGITTAMRNLDDFPGLAGVYTRQVVNGNSTPENRSYLLGVLHKLLAIENYAVVAMCAHQVLAAGGAEGDREFVEDVRRLQSEALPKHLQSLTGALADPDESKRSAAKDTLAAYGVSAADALVGALGSEAEPVRVSALELLAPLADGKTFDFDPRRAPQDQAEPLAKWKAWLSDRSGAQPAGGGA